MTRHGAGPEELVVPRPQSIAFEGRRIPFEPARVHITLEPGLEGAKRWLEAELEMLVVGDSHPHESTDLVVELAIGPAPAGVVAATGVDPAARPEDERHIVEIADGRVRIVGPTPRAVLRGVATLLQLLNAPDRMLPIVRIEDGPRYAWRGLSLDAVRHPFTVEEIDRVVDLLARYKLNVLHLHLTDAQGWRLASTPHPLLETVAGGPVITAEDLQALTARAAALGVTIVPEVDLPGHAAAAVRAYPALAANETTARLGYLDPAVEGVEDFIRAEVAEFAEGTDAEFLHIGGDEPFGMPEAAYREAIRIAVGAAHQAGKRVVAWQEAVRAGALDEHDLVQFWIGAENEIDVDAKKAELPPEAHRFVDAMVELFAKAPDDLPLAAAAGIPVLISSNDVLYLDRKYAEPAATVEGEKRRRRLGFPDYPAKTLREMHEWTPQALVEGRGVSVAGVEAAIWAESIESFDDLAFLLLPRLGSAAERAWQHDATRWDDYSGRIAAHRPVWQRLGWGAAFSPGTAEPGTARNEQER
ncbi:family 20 glycosylhydrolase [Microbacterium sp.]|uniref:family 20 glycosylhydrolase n=1 Tax=Microbacterium sp. TaxID=51671 RepID=UPI0028124614|nr:family 20 glycosylhydrolase [Microbacterium sp.]